MVEQLTEELAQQYFELLFRETLEAGEWHFVLYSREEGRVNLICSNSHFATLSGLRYEHGFSCTPDTPAASNLKTSNGRFLSSLCHGLLLHHKTVFVRARHAVECDPYVVYPAIERLLFALPSFRAALAKFLCENP